VIDDWIDSEQRRDLQSNSIDPFASVSKLLHAFGWQGTRLAGGLDNASAGFVLRRLRNRFRRLGDADFVCAQALSRALPRPPPFGRAIPRLVSPPEG
jgi:hypothetical protein